MRKTIMVLPASAGSMFQKVGDVLCSKEITGKNRSTFLLKCTYCTMICYSYDSFTLHMEECHMENFYQSLFGDGVETVVQQESPLEMEHAPQVEAQSFENVAEEIQTDEQKYSYVLQENKIYEDPLEQPPLSVDNGDCTSSKDDFETENEAEYNMDYSEVNADDHCVHESDTENHYEKSDCSEMESDNEPDTEEDGESKPDDLVDGEEKKEITLAIIASYKKHRLLWDSNEPLAKNRKKREEAYRRIAKSVNKRCGENLEAGDVSERIRKMRYKFRSDLQTGKLAESRGVNHTPVWYFQQLAFLNKVIKYKQRKKRGAKAMSNERRALPLSSLTEAQNFELIAIYKSFPCLWDVTHIGFRFKQQRQDALREMIETIKTRMSMELTPDDLQKKLYRIRYACTQMKHRKFQCELNGEEFEPTYSYYAQIAFLEDNVGPFKCPYCEEKFNGSDQYRIHMSKHDGSMPFTCPLCNRGFMKVGNCTVHLRRHTRDYSFECKECRKRFATSTDLNVHMRYHTGEKPYFCEVCGQLFRTWTFFDAHKRRHLKRPSHKCTVCEKAFYEKNKLNEHMKGHMNVRDKECNVCGKAFTSSKYLRQHKQIHAEKKKYSCRICGKTFAQYAGLSGHMKSHGTTVSGSTMGGTIMGDTTIISTTISSTTTSAAIDNGDDNY